MRGEVRRTRSSRRGRLPGPLLIPLLLAAVGLAHGVHAAWMGTDAEFTAKVEYDNWNFFNHNQGGPLMFFRSSGDHKWLTSGDPVASSAGDGFGIASLCVGAYRGWMSDEEAYARILPLLKTYANVLPRNDVVWTNGHVFSHWHWFETGDPWTPWEGTNNPSNADWSFIDSSWLLCGAVMAAEYFKGTEAETVANAIYDSLNYRDGYEPTWSGYHEWTIMNTLGAGALNGWDPGQSKWAWEYKYTNAACDVNLHGPLFWYQWPQVYVDYRGYRDGSNVDHFAKGIAAFLEQRAKCAALNLGDPTRYNDYGTNGWGLTAAGCSQAAVLHYLEMRPWGGWWSYTNYIGTDEQACDSGTLVPICLPACMAHVPTETRAAMLHIYDTYDWINVYQLYSFKNAFNTGNAWDNGSYYNDINAAMDYGANVLAVENYRSGMPWKYFMAHPRIQQGLYNCGITQTVFFPYHDDFNDGADPNAWGGTTYWASATAAYTWIGYVNDWVRDYAREFTGLSSGGIVRITLDQLDQSRNDVLSFWLKGGSGGEDFDVGLKDGEGHEYSVPIGDYVDGGVVPSDWCRVRIPLRKFAVTPDVNTDVRLTFLGDFSIQFNAAGTIYLDDLAFVGDDIAPDPPPLGAACIDGRVHLRWGYSTHDDVVGYHVYRRPDDTSAFVRINAALLSADHDEIDALVETSWGEDFYYAVQCLDRNGNYGPYSTGPYERRAWVGRRRDLDWGDGLDPNTFGGYDGGWGAAGWYITYELQPGWDGQTGWVRRVDAGADAGVFIELEGGSVASYDALCFWLKQRSGSDDFEVGLRSTNTNEVKVAISRYVPGGVVPTNAWTYVIIPLIDFKGVDFTSMDNLSFAFNAVGSVWADEIRFARLDQDGERIFVREAEAADGHQGGSTGDFKWYASRAYVLGDGWAGSADDDAWFVLSPTQELNEAYLDVRYACGASSGRVLQVLINDDHRADLAVSATGGWGTESWHFREDTVRLGLVTNDAFLLKLRAAESGNSVNLDRVILRSAAPYFREAEDGDAQYGSGGADSKSGASGGEVLGDSWGATNGSFAAYSNILLSSVVSGAVLRARYGQNWPDGRLVRVRLDGRDMGELAFAPSGGWLSDWVHGALAQLPLGTVSAGVHTLWLEAEGDDQPVNLDWVRIADQASVFNEYDTDGDGIPDSQESVYGTLASQADTDGDGLTDQQEISVLCGGLTGPNDADSDDDDMTDGDEYVAGTDPTDSNSVFAVSTALRAGGSTVLSWPGSVESTYDVQYWDGVFGGTGSFRSVTNPGDITVTNGSAEYVDDGTGTPCPPADINQRAYRLRASRP